MKCIVYLVAAAAIGLSCGCKAQNGTPAESVLTTEALELTDSLNYGRSSAEVTISGQYPDSGVPVLVDSCRQWLADCLSWGAFSSNQPIIRPSRAEIDNPQKLIAHLSKKLLDSSRRDFIEFESEPDLRVDYEYRITFEPTWISNAIVTYNYSGFCYLGGAHGSTTARIASFEVSTGRMLTFSNVFRPDRQKELIAKIRQGLWEQYFTPLYAGEPEAPQSLNDALLINPQELGLPLCNPGFGPDGVTFTYGQYEIASYASGQPTCTISYAELSPLMVESVANLIAKP